jgi:hypothetical protein
MCILFPLLAAGVLLYLSVKLLRENSQTDNPERKVLIVIPVAMLALAGLFIAYAAYNFYQISQLP